MEGFNIQEMPRVNIGSGFSGPGIDVPNNIKFHGSIPPRAEVLGGQVNAACFNREVVLHAESSVSSVCSKGGGPVRCWQADSGHTLAPYNLVLSYFLYATITVSARTKV